MKKQIKDLELCEVDYLVAKAEGYEIERKQDMQLYRKSDSSRILINSTNFKEHNYSPTTNAAQAWPIIERERIELNFDKDENQWIGLTLKNDDEYFFENGKTSLEAAMRCLCAKIYDNEIEIDW